MTPANGLSILHSGCFGFTMCNILNDIHLMDLYTMLRRVVCFIGTDVSEKFASSLLSIEKYCTIKGEVC
jgi:hypothetical protein